MDKTIGLTLGLLGSFRLEAHGKPIPLATKKARALLAYLAQHAGEVQPRGKLATLLWADSDEVASRNSLRQTLSLVRKAITPINAEAIATDTETIMLRQGAVELDTATFERLTADATRATLDRAIALYRGTFLEGFDGPTPEFEHWLASERARLNEKALAALSKLLAHHLASNSAESGIAVANRLLSIDPAREEVHRALMELYCRQGRLSSALRQYKVCAATLERELGIEPDDATKVLRREILTRRHRPEARWRVTHLQGQVEVTRPALSIVVLPFVNYGNEPGQEHFADGITDDLTTDLSKISGSFVIARNTAFTFKGKSIDVKRIGQELGVRYVLDGSVRRIGQGVRINAQLIDASTGANLWAHRFDRDIRELMAWGDDVSGPIAQALDVELVNAESRRGLRERPNSPTAVDLTMRGRAMLNLPEGPRELLTAPELFGRALAIDSGIAHAWAGLAKTYSRSFIGRWTTTPVDDVQRADEAISQAIELDPHNAWIRYVRGEVLQAQRRHEEALAEQYRAIELNRNLADAHGRIGFYKNQLGHPDEALVPVQHALRLSPRDPYAWTWHYLLGMVHFFMGRDEEAISWLKKSNMQYSQTHGYMIAAYALAGHDVEARAALMEFQRNFPGYSVGRFRAEGYSDNSGYVTRRERLLVGLRKAGMPEE